MPRAPNRLMPSSIGLLMIPWDDPACLSVIQMAV
jgi:hypothetical protein